MPWAASPGHALLGLREIAGRPRPQADPGEFRPGSLGPQRRLHPFELGVEQGRLADPGFAFDQDSSRFVPRLGDEPLERFGLVAPPDDPRVGRIILPQDGPPSK